MKNRNLLIWRATNLDHQNYELPIQRILRKPEPEVSKIEGKQEAEIRIFRLKDKDRLPREFENENPDKILLEGETVVYVFRVRPWLRRVR